MKCSFLVIGVIICFATMTGTAVADIGTFYYYKDGTKIFVPLVERSGFC